MATAGSAFCPSRGVLPLAGQLCPQTATWYPPVASASTAARAMVAGAILVVVLSAVGVWFAVQPASGEIMLVVLPLYNDGPADREYFADGMTDEITTRLNYIHGLTVISRESAAEFKEMGIQVARESYPFDYYLEGSVQCESPSDPNSLVTIRIRLINAADSAQVWGRSYQRHKSA